MPLSGPRTSESERKLPLWTWIAGLLLLHLGSWISVQFKIDEGISAIYLPTAIGIVLVNWWGPWRVVPLVYASAVLSSSLWNVQGIGNWFLFSLPETLMVFLSWFLFSYKAQGKYWLPDIKSLLLFLTLGIIVPIIPELLLLQGYLFGRDKTLLKIIGLISSGTAWANLLQASGFHLSCCIT
jgi:hypothetical protein